MKRLILLALMTVILSDAYSQNTFPSFGNVGVGTTSPEYSLDVNGSLRLLSDYSNFTSSTNGRTWQINPGSASIDFLPPVNGNKCAMINRNCNSDLLINAGGGNLMVGYPAFSITNYKLDVNGNTHVSGSISADGSYLIHSPDGNDAGSLQASGEPGSNNGVEIISTRGSETIRFYTNPSDGTTEIARFANNGNLGIGTTAPQSKLAVNGTVTAKQVKVTQSGWPDFIFDSTYHLPALTTTELFIKAHHHLPGIPVAKDIDSSGLDLGEMQKKQMEKIEELTRYLIDMDKKMQVLEEKVNDQRAVNRKLNKQISLLQSKQEDQ